MLQNFKAKLTLFGLLLVASFSLAAQDALNCPNWVPKTFKAVYSEKAGLLGNGGGSWWDPDYKTPITCEQVGTVGTVLQEVNKLVDGKLGVPKTPYLNLIDEDGNAYLAGNIINVPMKIIFDGYGKHPIYTHAVWAHEYGHAIFGHNMKYALKDWAEMDRNMKSYIEFMMKYTLRATRLQKYAYELDQLKKAHSDDLERINYLAKQIDQIQEQINAMEKESEKFNDLNFHDDLNTFSGGYNELFADTVAVMHAGGKGDIIADSLFRTGLWEDKNYKSMIKNRDFTNRENRIERWKVVTEEHDNFAPTRYHLYKYYIDNPIYRRYKGYVVYKLFISIKLEFEKYLPALNKIDMEDPDTIVYLNKSLMKRIDEEFAKDKKYFSQK